MPFLKSPCPICGKTAETKSVFQIKGSTMLYLHCGHMMKQDQLVRRDASSIKALNGNKLMPFQIKGVEFLERANGRALLGDEAGLGKTVQTLAFLLLHPELFPVVIVPKANLLIQWQRQFANWCSEDDKDGYRFAQILSTTKDVILPGMPAYIVSYDLLPRFASKKLVDDHGHPINTLEKALVKRGVKTLILDECQMIKNHTSQRSVALRNIANNCQNVLACSGTPIKNHAGEFFSVLNMVKPEIFNNQARFLRDDVVTSWNGYGPKVGGLKNPELFKKKTENFIIRRERAEVLPDLPLVQRSYMYNELGDKVEEAYIETFKAFRDNYNAQTGDSKDDMSTLAYLSRMRHLTGYAKIDPCLDYLMEFLGSTDNERITIFCHHVDVADILTQKLTELCQTLEFDWKPVNMVGMAAEQRERVKDDWILSKSRVLILSTLASGEGLDGLQHVCHRMVTLEREWNPANEEQVEGRLSRIGQLANQIDNTFFIAVGTVDEFFAEVVEKKREIVNSALRGEHAAEWSEASIIKELAEILAVSGGRKWGI